MLVDRFVSHWVLRCDKTGDSVSKLLIDKKCFRNSTVSVICAIKLNTNRCSGTSTSTGNHIVTGHAFFPSHNHREPQYYSGLTIKLCSSVLHDRQREGLSEDNTSRHVILRVNR